MKSDGSHPFSGLHWRRLCVKLVNIRSLPAMTAHPFSVFQAIIKGVSSSLSPLSPLPPSPERGDVLAIPPNIKQECPLSPDQGVTPCDNENKKETIRGDRSAEESDDELLPVFHVKNRRHNFRMQVSDTIPLEIYFFRKGEGYARQWRDAFRAYLADPETGRNFEMVEMAEIEERSFEMVAAEHGIHKGDGEMCLEFLTPFPFKAVKGKSRTYISQVAFIKSFERRFSRLLGREIVYHSRDDLFSILPYYWNYTEIRHGSRSQGGHTQYINGCVGKLYIKGRFHDFLPFLILGSELHAGTKLSNSQGYYLAHGDSPGYFTGFFPAKKAIVSVINDVVDRYDNALQSLSETEMFPFNEEVYAENVLQQITGNTYLPSPATAFTIKKKGGDDRLVEQLQVRDLIVQQYLLKTISTVFDRFFEEESIGCRKGVSRQRSVEIIQAAIAEGFQYVLESDIEDFYPSVDLKTLTRQLDYYIPEKDTVLKDILLKSIRHGYILNGVCYERRKGLAQGSPLSPILANLYLDAFDERVKQWNGGSDEATIENSGGGCSPVPSPMAGAGDVALDLTNSAPSGGVRMVRYADDFIILTKTKEDAERVLAGTESFLSQLGLKIKKEKTAIRSIAEGFQFLGMRFEKSAVVVEHGEDFKLLKKPLYITEPYLFLSLNGDALDMYKDKKIIETIPLRRISEIMVMEKSVFSTALIRKCTDSNIPFTITLNTGYYITTIRPDTKKHYDVCYEHGRRFYGLSDTEHLSIAKEFAAGKLRNYISFFKQRYEKDMHLFIGEIEGLVRQMYYAGDVQQARGFEGLAARRIYKRLNNFIDHEAFHLKKRERRNPDRINSLLNFGYYLLFSRINATVRAVGLNPYLGFLHSDQDNYESLVCDIEELFRAKIDRLIVRLINLKMITEEDFIGAENGWYLKKEAVKTFVNEFEAEMEKKDSKNTLSFKEAIYVQTDIFKKWALENGALSFYRWEA
ncbi:MAG: putative RNA-directed polymerase [Candidatus Brocadiaceae bacterium]|nr:putative RNA-directed polymerase [Candidatus Brocadiaceae bacterium]